MKYEQRQKVSTSANVPKVIPHVVHAPENVINVTIIKEASPRKSEPPPTMRVSKSVGKCDVQAQTDKPEKDNEEPVKQSKRLLRLPRNVKTKNPKIIYKKGIVNGVKNGVLIRNTPTDLFKKYQDDWIKFKSYIPGENSRLNVRRSIRKKMQQKDVDDAKVRANFNVLSLPSFHENLISTQMSSSWLNTYKITK